MEEEVPNQFSSLAQLLFFSSSLQPIVDPNLSSCSSDTFIFAWYFHLDAFIDTWYFRWYLILSSSLEPIVDPNLSSWSCSSDTFIFSWYFHLDTFIDTCYFHLDTFIDTWYFHLLLTPTCQPLMSCSSDTFIRAAEQSRVTGWPGSWPAAWGWHRPRRWRRRRGWSTSPGWGPEKEPSKRRTLVRWALFGSFMWNWPCILGYPADIFWDALNRVFYKESLIWGLCKVKGAQIDFWSNILCIFSIQ